MTLMLVILGALMLTVIVSLLYSNTDIQQESVQGEMAIAIFAQELHTRTSLRISEIAAMCSNTLFRTRIVEDTDGYHLPDGLLLQLQTGQIVTVPYTLTDNPVSLLMLDDMVLEVRPRHNASLLRLSLVRVLSTVLLSLLFLSVFAYFAGNRIIRPLLSLSQAMQKVAQGNFNVRMSVKKDDELGMLLTNFNHMVEELASIDYLQKDFITNVSHEFKTPVASISGYAKLLQSDTISEAEHKEYAQIIISEAQRLSRLSANLLRLAKLENQSSLEETAVFSLDEQLRVAIVLLEPEWQKKSIVWDIDLLQVQYRGDAELLNLVWQNLLSNAIKFSHPQGVISVSLYRTDCIKVKIKDKGIGMDSNIQNRIFDKFYQGDISHKVEGNGLGLTLVQRIIELSRGKIKVKSIPGEGTSFTVSLPLDGLCLQSDF
jgi:signal transduction histidine kinase